MGNKNYLIITPSISNLGGAQLYILRRAKYLIRNGYSVKVIVSHHNATNFILEKQFLSIPILFLHELQKPISFFSKKKMDSFIHRIKSFLGDFDHGITESSSLETSVWGELIAARFNCKHITYLLAEPRISQYIFFPGYDFFEYKLNRGEFYGTSEYSLPLVFGKPIDEDKNQFVNIPFDPAELAEQSTPSLEIQNIDQDSFIIGTIARLEKPYVKPFIESCIRFAAKHPEKKITLIIAGGSEKIKLFNQLKDTYSAPSLRTPNLYILFTGYINVLGKDFFKVLDVFVGMGTASINAISQSCATLNMDPDTSECSGIFGIDTDNFAYPKNGKVYLLEDKLEALTSDVQLLQTAKLKGTELFIKEYSIKNCFGKLDKSICISPKNNNYFLFNFTMVTCIKDRIRYVEGHAKTKIFQFIQFLRS